MNKLVIHMPYLERIDKKSTRILFSWRGELFAFGTIELKSDGSLFFSSAFHSTPEITTGEFRTQGNLFIDSKERLSEKINSSTHVSLHPGNQKIHFKTNDGLNILETKKNWFPVKKHFRLFNLISLPINLCKSVKKTGVKIIVPDDYLDSIEMFVDIYPRDTREYVPVVPALMYVEGFCPDYFLVCTFVKSNQRVLPVIYWKHE